MLKIVNGEFIEEFKKLLEKHKIDLKESWDFKVSESEAEGKIYLDSLSFSFGSKYNPSYDKDNPPPCICGHTYYRHFDSYDQDSDYISCKYCSCSEFIPFNSENMILNLELNANEENISFFKNSVCFDVDVNVLENGNIIHKFRDFVNVFLEDGCLKHKFKVVDDFPISNSKVHVTFNPENLQKILMTLDFSNSSIDEENLFKVIDYVKNL